MLERKLRLLIVAINTIVAANRVDTQSTAALDRLSKFFASCYYILMFPNASHIINRTNLTTMVLSAEAFIADAAQNAGVTIQLQEDEEEEEDEDEEEENDN